jgi:ABC-type sugar transport system substrate-binding protein
VLSGADKNAITDLCSSCSADVLNVPIGSFLAGQAPSSVVSYLQAHPKINYVYVIGFPGAMRSVLDSAGLKRVKIAGQVSTLSNNAGAKSGDFIFWIDTPNGYVGGLALDSMVRAFTGGDRAIHNNEQMPTWAITKDSAISTTSLPEFPTGYSDDFKRLWNVG